MITTKQSDMQKPKLEKARLPKIFLLLVLVSAVYAGVSAFAQDDEKKAYEPAGTFVPTEKLSADDTVAFPVDI